MRALELRDHRVHCLHVTAKLLKAEDRCFEKLKLSCPQTRPHPRVHNSLKSLAKGMEIPQIGPSSPQS